MGLRDIALAATITLAASCGSSQVAPKTPREDPPINMSICTVQSNNYSGTDIRFCAEDNSDDLQQRLELIGLIKRYGQDRLGLVASENYLQYVSPRQASEQRMFILYATPEFIIPNEWESLRVRSNGANQCDGDDPCHLWAFNVDDLQDERRYYDHRGFDTYWHTTTNFGSGADITHFLFDQPITWWVNTVFHEEFHHDRRINQVHWDSYVEESLATAFGRVMAVYFIEENWGQNKMLDYSMIQEARDRIESRRVHAEFVNRYVTELRNIYNSDESIARINQQRDACVSRAEDERRSVNNAYLWHEHAYSIMYPIAADIAMHCSRDEFVEIMRITPARRSAAILHLESNLARLTQSSGLSSP